MTNKNQISSENLTINLQYKILKLMEIKKISKEDLANKLNIQTSNIENMLCCNDYELTIKDLDEICKVLNATIKIEFNSLTK